MEIALVSHAALRIKGKQMTIGVDQVDKNNSRGTILLQVDHKTLTLPEDHVFINGAGEYEVGGLKMTGTRSGQHVVYSINVDGVEILIGKIASFEAMQHKLKEHHIVVALCDSVVTASFLTALASNVVIFYGEKAGEISQAFGKDNVKPMAKYVTTKDKLPQEVETIVLE